MLDIALNAVKVALSDDARKSAASLLEILRRKPEWERDICTLNAKVPKSSREQALLLSELCKAKMVSLKYASATIAAFETSFVEVSNNAFEHACIEPKDVVELTLDITDGFIALKVLDPIGERFDMEKLLIEKRAALRAEPNERRGRGLLLVSELADEFQSIENLRGVKALFYRDRVVIEKIVKDGIAILSVTGGVHNPSFERRLTSLALAQEDSHLVINFRGLVIGSSGYLVILKLKELYEEFGKKVIAWLPTDSAVVLPDEIAAYTSWDEIVERLAE